MNIRPTISPPVRCQADAVQRRGAPGASVWVRRAKPTPHRVPVRGITRRVQALVVSLCLAGFATTASAQVAVIAHKNVPVDSLSKTDILDYYTGDVQSWDGRINVVVLDLKSRGPVRDTFYDYLGKTSSRMRSIWLKRKLSGEGDPPESFETEEALLERVASTPGAIGFVQKSKVSGDVKILVEIEIDEDAL